MNINRLVIIVWKTFCSCHWRCCGGATVRHSTRHVHRVPNAQEGRGFLRPGRAQTQLAQFSPVQQEQSRVLRLKDLASQYYHLILLFLLPINQPLYPPPNLLRVKSAYLYSALLPSKTKSLLFSPDPLLPSLLFRFRIPIVVGEKQQLAKPHIHTCTHTHTHPPMYTHTDRYTHTEEINNNKSMERGRKEWNASQRQRASFIFLFNKQKTNKIKQVRKKQ